MSAPALVERVALHEPKCSRQRKLPPPLSADNDIRVACVPSSQKKDGPLGAELEPPAEVEASCCLATVVTSAGFLAEPKQEKARQEPAIIAGIA